MNATQTAPVVDTSDLDEANESHRGCHICYPDYLPFGARFVAICGEEAIARGIETWDAGSGACAACENTMTCPRCEP